MKRVVTVWWPDWPVVAAGASAGPAIVLRANRVVARSPSTAAEGVAIGQRRRIAQQRCPEAVILDHDPARDARAFEPVVRAVAAFTPRVEQVEPGWLSLDARGPSRYFGGDEAFAGRVAAAAVDAVGPMGGGTGVGVGIADGCFAAAVAARRSAGRGGRPVIVPAGATPAFLAPLPVAWLHELGEADPDAEPAEGARGRPHRPQRPAGQDTGKRVQGAGAHGFSLTRVLRSTRRLAMPRLMAS